jgi:SAM-dependent methyltransferase
VPAREFDAAIALRSLEHFPSSESAIRSLFQALKPGGMLYLSAGNVAFIAMRFLLLFGEFNYARRGLLDFGHKRLFTVKSLRRLLRDQGFRVERIVAFGPPIADLWLARGAKVPGWAAWLDRALHWLAKKSPNLFGFHILAMATRLEAAGDLLRSTVDPEKPSFAETEIDSMEKGHPEISLGESGA